MIVQMVEIAFWQASSNSVIAKKPKQKGPFVLIISLLGAER
jgi:hypothetical protein